MPRYATNTKVSVDKSRTEIESILTRYGASKFMYGHDHVSGYTRIEFEAHDRRVRFELKLPNPNGREFTHTPGRDLERSPADAHRQWEQACRQRWRALVLCIKAKLEAVEAEITTFEEEFLAHIVVPGDRTLGQLAIPQIAQAYTNGKAPRLLIEDKLVAS